MLKLIGKAIEGTFNVIVFIIVAAGYYFIKFIKFIINKLRGKQAKDAEVLKSHEFIKQDDLVYAISLNKPQTKINLGFYKKKYDFKYMLKNEPHITISIPKSKDEEIQDNLQYAELYQEIDIGFESSEDDVYYYVDTPFEYGKIPLKYVDKLNSLSLCDAPMCIESMTEDANDNRKISIAIFNAKRQSLRRTDMSINERANKGKSLIKFPDEFTLIDIETTGLDYYCCEIIELAAIKIKDKEIVGTFETLVKPCEEIPDDIVELTKITNEMVANAPPIKDVLQRYLDFIENDIVIGQNVNFDINFIYDNALEFLNKEFSNDFIDTWRISSKALPDLPHHRLKDLIKFFKVPTTTTHRALADCENLLACYNAIITKIESEETLDNFVKRFGQHKPKISAKDITAATTDFDETSPIFNQTFVFTGKLDKMERPAAMQLVADRGGLCGDHVTKKTNYLVVGNFDMRDSIKNGRSVKMKKADELHAQGLDVNVISENVFYDMLDF